MLYDEDFLARLAQGLGSILPLWGLGTDASVRLLTISENATFLVSDAASGQQIVVRVHRPGYHSRDEILSELAWSEALRKDGVVHTPGAIPARDGSLLQSFSDGEHQRFAVAFEFVPGKEPDAESDLRKWYGVLGEANARLHLHSRDWQKPQNFTRKVWDFDHIIGPSSWWGDWRAGLGLTAEGKATLERAAAELEKRTAAYGLGEDRFGLVHCDMRASNLLVEGDRLSVIDFDDCGLSWFVYDFAAAISFMEAEPVVPELMAAWLEGYRRVSSLAGEHEAMLPVFIMLRRMQLTAWIASHAETPTAEMMGSGYTDGTVALAERFLSGRFLATA